jgi:cob(I)alamin adenosyltransferase
MKIYTRTGDDGSTGLFGGARLPKDDPRVEAYGTVDEANACIGLARAESLPAELDAMLSRLQSDLLVLGAELACVPGHEARLPVNLLGESDIERLERTIDDLETGLTPLKNFILPGGTRAGAALHLARTVARRAERRALRAQLTTPIRGLLVVYLNRLSDLLFVLARSANASAGYADVPWNR